MYKRQDTYNVPRMAFINKMDIMGADFYGAVDQIKTRSVSYTHLPIVNKGDHVEAGDILADGASTCGGEMALGKMCIRDSS